MSLHERSEYRSPAGRGRLGPQLGAAAAAVCLLAVVAIASYGKVQDASDRMK